MSYSIMFILGIILGIYAYGIFFLGLVHLLYREYIIIYSLLCIVVSYLIFYKKYNWKTSIIYILNCGKLLIKNRFAFFLSILIFIQALINYIGALAPELSFDALWYHLTLPKLYLLSHSIIHIPGSLIPYSDMPKLGELLYTSALALGDERMAKLLQFGAGIFCCFLIYRLSRNYVSRKYALIAVVIFYSNIAVAWESTTAYIDLIRTVFELLALWSYLEWFRAKYQKWLYLSAVFTGLAITTKLLGIGSLIIFLILLWFSQYKLPLFFRLRSILIYTGVALLIPLPWFIFSFLHTGNPVYPFFTSLYPTGISTTTVNPILFLQTVIRLFTSASDPVSPIYLIVLPLIFWKYKTFSKEIKLLSWYSLLALVAWYITPQTGGGRFIIPYLPAFSVLIAYLLFLLAKQNDLWSNRYRNTLIGLVIFLALTTIVYRGAASVRYLPVIFGDEIKSEFLSNNLNFSFGDFYDTDEYFKKHIQSSDTVLLYGFHNLYYVDFPFIDASWIKKGDRFTYIACQNTALPKRFSHWQLVYTNMKTHVKLYADGGKVWKY